METENKIEKIVFSKDPNLYDLMEILDNIFGEKNSTYDFDLQISLYAEFVKMDIPDMKWDLFYLIRRGLSKNPPIDDFLMGNSEFIVVLSKEI